MHHVKVSSRGYVFLGRVRGLKSFESESRDLTHCTCGVFFPADVARKRQRTRQGHREKLHLLICL
jgi:hypothetical protein